MALAATDENARPGRSLGRPKKSVKLPSASKRGTVYSEGGNLLTSTGDIVACSSIIWAEVTEVVWTVLCDKALGVDEICPEYLKSLDIVRMSWLPYLCDFMCKLGTVPLEGQGGGPPYQKEQKMCSNYPPGRLSHCGSTMWLLPRLCFTGPALHPPHGA